MEIIFNNKRMPGRAVVDKMREAAALCLAEKNVTNENTEISVSFVSVEVITGLNRQYRNSNKVTDVLSFPQYESACDIPESGKALLGDIVICTDQALLQAHEFGHSPERELVYLLVHGIFHILGCNHIGDEETKRMRIMEEKVMTAVGLAVV